MKKLLLLLALTVSLPSLSLVYAGSSDDEYFSDESDEIEVDDTTKDTLLFDQIFLSQFTTQDSRLLFLAGFFSSSAEMFAEYSKISAEIPCGTGNLYKFIIFKLCDLVWNKEFLVNVIKEVCDVAICSDDSRERMIEQLGALKDKIETDCLPEDMFTIFYRRAVREILLLYPECLIERYQTDAGRLLCLGNFFDEYSIMLKNTDTNDWIIVDRAFNQGLFIYDSNALALKIKNILEPIVGAEDINLLIKKLDEFRRLVFKDFENRNVEILNARDIKRFIELSAQFCDQAIRSILDISVGSKCVRYFKPVGNLFAMLPSP